MRGCAGAGSTQVRTLTCVSPPSLALHPCLDLYRFRVLSNSDRAPVFLFVFQHLSRPGGCKVWAGSGSRLLMFDDRALLGGLRALNQLDLSRLGFGFRFGSWRLVFFRCSLGGMPPILNTWTCLDQAGASLGWVWLEAFLLLRRCKTVESL